MWGSGGSLSSVTDQLVKQVISMLKCFIKMVPSVHSTNEVLFFSSCKHSTIETDLGEEEGIYFSGTSASEDTVDQILRALSVCTRIDFIFNL